MIGQDLEDERPEPLKRKTVGVMLAEDDLEVGQFVCVYNLKRTDEGAPIMGQSLQVKAICLPFFVGQLLSDPSEPVLTLDCRFLNLMKVTPEFVQAQKEGAKAQQQDPMQMAMPPSRRRKRQDDAP
jgi:hypothetical protein